MLTGLEGPESAFLDTNVRVLRGTPVSTPLVNTTSQTAIYVALATTQGVGGTPQAAPCEGVIGEDVTEPGFPVSSADNPSSQSPGGTNKWYVAPPAPYDLRLAAVNLMRNGNVMVFAYAGYIKQHDRVCFAPDGYRIQSIRAAFGAGLAIPRIGIAKMPSTAINDLVEVQLDLGTEHT